MACSAYFLDRPLGAPFCGNAKKELLFSLFGWVGLFTKIGRRKRKKIKKGLTNRELCCIIQKTNKCSVAVFAPN